MAFTAITSAMTQAGRPVTQTLMDRIKDNFDDHETRVSTLETSGSSGSGGGLGVNFVNNYDAELNAITGWALYNDSAQYPVDGFGGVAGITFVNDDAFPLAGSRSFVFTKGASNRRGDGVAYTFTVDQAYRAKACSISFDYIISSGGVFAAGSRTDLSDVIVYIYDVTNSQLIEPSNIKLFSNSTSVSDKFEAQFQTSATGEEYRLILHVQGTSTSAYTLILDNFFVGPSEYVFGTPVTDWDTTWVPTGSWVTATTYLGAKRRVGDTMEYIVTIALTGAPTSATLTINLPHTTDDSKLGHGGTSTVFGFGLITNAGSESYPLVVRYATTTTVTVSYTDDASAGVTTADVTQAAPISWNTSDRVRLRFSIPTVGMSSSVQMSDRADTRVVAMRARRGSSTQTVSSTSATTVVFNTITSSEGQRDTHGGLNTSTGVYTIPIGGWYSISSCLALTNVTSAERIFASIDVDGTDVAQAVDNDASTGRRILVSSGPIYLNSGQAVSIQVQSTADTSYDIANSIECYFAINSIQGPSAIAASETIAVTANRVGAQAIASTAATQVVFNSAEVDTHGILNTSTGTITIPAAGLYLISSNIVITSLTAAEAVEALISRSVGLPIILGDQANYDNSTTRVFGVVGKLARMTAGETITLTVDSVADSSYNVTTGSFISVVRIGL